MTLSAIVAELEVLNRRRQLAQEELGHYLCTAEITEAGLMVEVPEPLKKAPALIEEAKLSPSNAGLFAKATVPDLAQMLGVTDCAEVKAISTFLSSWRTKAGNAQKTLPKEKGAKRSAGAS